MVSDEVNRDMYNGFKHYLERERYNDAYKLLIHWPGIVKFIPVSSLIKVLPENRNITRRPINEMETI